MSSCRKDKGKGASRDTRAKDGALLARPARSKPSMAPAQPGQCGMIVEDTKI